MSKIVQDITLAKRAGKLSLGFDVTKDALQKGTAALIITAKDLSPKTKKEINYLAGEFEVPILELDITLDELWYLIGKRAGVIAVNDDGFAMKMEKDNCENNSDKM